MELLKSTEQAVGEGQFDEALKLVEEAILIDDRYAHLSYLYGQVLWELQRYVEARKAFVRARDEDVCPLRALTPISETIRQVGMQFDTPVVDFVDFLDNHSEHAIPGSDWFLDHVHPTIAGNRALALELVSALAEEGLLQIGPKWGEAAVKRLTVRVEGEIDREAHATALRNLSKVLAWAGKIEEAERLAIRAQAGIEDDPEAEYQAGSAYLNRNEFDRAIERFRRSLELRPKNARAHFGLAKAFESKREFTAAVSHYLQAIKLNPNDEDAHYNLARVFEEMDEYDQASNHYRAAIAINPKHFFSHNNLGSLLAGQNRLDEAQKHFLAAVRVKPDLSHAHVNLGLIYEMKGQVREAAASFRAALKSQPDHFGAAFHLVAILATHPDVSVRDGATAVYWGKRLAYSPEMQEFWGGSRPPEFEQPVVLSLLAAAFAETADFAEAVKVQQEAIDMLPVSRQSPYKELLDLYRDSKRYPHEPQQER
jgi:tetratricopeptide (TPR) repeat protein